MSEEEDYIGGYYLQTSNGGYYNPSERWDGNGLNYNKAEEQYSSRLALYIK